MSLADKRPGKFDYGPPRCDGHRAIPGAARAVRALAGRIRSRQRSARGHPSAIRDHGAVAHGALALRGFDSRTHSGRYIRFARGWAEPVSTLCAATHFGCNKVVDASLSRWRVRYGVRERARQMSQTRSLCRPQVSWCGSRRSRDTLPRRPRFNHSCVPRRRLTRPSVAASAMRRLRRFPVAMGSRRIFLPSRSRQTCGRV